MAPPSRPASRAALGHAGFQLWLLNVLVGTLVGSLWLFRTPADVSFGLRLYLSLALLSSVVVIGLLPGLAFTGAHHLILRRWPGSGRWLGVIQSLLGAVFLAGLYTDTFIYRLLRYHANGAVLNVALTEGSGDAIHLETRIWVATAVVLAILTTLQFLFWRWRLVAILRREEGGRPQALLLQPRVICLAFFLPAIGIDKSVYAMASLTGDRELLYASRPIPGLKPRLGHLLDSATSRGLEVNLMPDEARLQYPRVAPELPADGPRPSMLVLVLDSWRRDAFTPELTPNLTSFQEGSRVFENHKSGGNGTRYGLFSMLYGLHGSYWFRVLEEQRTPALIDALQAADYDIRVLSAASMNFPEFRMTAWAGLEKGQVVDAFLDPSGRPISRRADVKDEMVAAGFEEWMAQRAEAQDERPFFGFVLLDSPHQPYFNPGGPHEPALDALSYLELGLAMTEEEHELEALRERVMNSYRNSVLHADRVAGRILASLSRSCDLEDTVVMVTGDHGEEFYENGFWGHTSNFTPEQVDVPLYLRGPGVEPGVEARPTSHLDVSGSLLELLGADPARLRDYSLGVSLFEPDAARRRVFGAWAHIGLSTPSGIFHLPLDPAMDEVWVFDDDWQPLLDVESRVETERNALDQTAQECLHFLELGL